MSTIPEERNPIDHYETLNPREQLLGMLVVLLVLLLAIALRSL